LQHYSFFKRSVKPRQGAESFLSVYNEFSLINKDLSRRCGLCPKR